MSFFTKNLKARIIPSLLYSTVKANLPVDANLMSLSDSGIISESDFNFLLRAHFGQVDSDDTSLLGNYNRWMMVSSCDWIDCSKAARNYAPLTSNQYAHDMCSYVTTSDLCEVGDLNYVLIATDWIRTTCLFQPYAVYNGEVHGFKPDPIPLLDAIKESFTKIFEVVPMNDGLSSDIFRRFAERYCA